MDGDLKDDLASTARTGPLQLNTKKIFLIALIAIGAFFGYVIFLKPKTAAATDTTATSAPGTTATVLDPSAIGSLQTQNEALAQQLSGVNTNVSGARTDAAAANNGVNDIIYGVLPNGKPLPNSAIAPKVTPKPAPVQVGKPAVPMPLAKGMPVIAHPPTQAVTATKANTSAVAHLQASGLAHQV